MRNDNRILDLVKNGYLQKAMEDLWILLEISTRDSNMEDQAIGTKNDLILLMANLDDLEKKKLINTIKDNDYIHQKNHILNSFLKLHDNIQKIDGLGKMINNERETLLILNRYKKFLSKNRNKSRSQSIFEKVNMIGVTVIAVFLLLMLNQQRVQHKHNLKLQSSEIINAAPAQLDLLRTPLLDRPVLTRFFDENRSTPLTHEETLWLFNACSNQDTDTPSPFDCEDKLNVFNLLNYMEYICSSYLNQLCDQQMIEESFGDILCQVFYFFERLIIKVGEDPKRTTKAWEPFQDFIDEYKQRFPKGYRK